MVWFGSSAGVALCNMYREARSVVQWLRYGWWIVIAYVVSFLAMLSVSRWHPDPVSSQPTQTACVTVVKIGGSRVCSQRDDTTAARIELSW
jgi:hypothetical protein